MKVDVATRTGICMSFIVGGVASHHRNLARSSPKCRGVVLRDIPQALAFIVFDLLKKLSALCKVGTSNHYPSFALEKYPNAQS